VGIKQRTAFFRHIGEAIMFVVKPWGHEVIWAKTDKYVGKILNIEEGHSLSLQFHKVKDETIFLLCGKLEFFYDGKTEELTEGMTRHIMPMKHHRMKALTNSMVLEVSTPELDDVVRLVDNYGRVEQ
jgi:mannose-6-phosphate isomerase